MFSIFNSFMRRVGELWRAMHSEGFSSMLFRFVERTLKVTVIACDAVMTIHCAMLLLGCDMWIGEILCGYSLTGTIVLLLASYLLHFCWRYRLAILHAFAVNCCITWQREYGFNEWLTPMRITMLVLGIIILYSNIRTYIKTKTP